MILTRGGSDKNFISGSISSSEPTSTQLRTELPSSVISYGLNREAKITMLLTQVLQSYVKNYVGKSRFLWFKTH